LSWVDEVGVAQRRTVDVQEPVLLLLVLGYVDLVCLVLDAELLEGTADLLTIGCAGRVSSTPISQIFLGGGVAPGWLTDRCPSWAPSWSCFVRLLVVFDKDSMILICSRGVE